MLERVVEVEISAAVCERIGGSVEDAHDQRLSPWPQPVDSLEATSTLSLSAWCPGRCVLGQLDSYFPILNSKFLIPNSYFSVIPIPSPLARPGVSVA
jgi:hypothetical protein